MNQEQNNKKKKYWLIPVFIFLAMILAQIVNITLRLVGVESPIISSFLSVMYVVCGIAFIPSVVVAIVLSCKNK